MTTAFYLAENAEAVKLASVPVLSMDTLREELKAHLEQNCRILAFFDAGKVADRTRLLTVLLDPVQKKLLLAQVLADAHYPALTCSIPALHWFERELWENTNIVPEGHPWLKPIRFSRPDDVCGITEYFKMHGAPVHEVAVGPVHAGVIEPGHFRFQCFGETVHFLEIELGYQHRGVEKLLGAGPDGRSIHFAETASGDTSAAAALAYSRIMESGNCPPRAAALRRIGVELERIANHIGDLGALAGDVAYLPTSSYCGRIRGDFLNMTATLCGNRFGRGFIRPGGVRYDVSPETVEGLLKRIAAGEKDLWNALDLMFDEPSVLDRFENTGTVTAETARKFGACGMAARASGVNCDARRDLAPAAPLPADFAVKCRKTGDVLSRAKVRRDELAVSLAMVKTLLNDLPAGAVSVPVPEKLCADTVTVSVTEAWRGELVHAAVTGADGRFLRYKIVDPSFHNWFMLAMALRDQQISDFPICNKSFNLSYCGHDL